MPTTKIEPEFKKKWLEALRSEKYLQGRLFLRNTENKYCCLGVACDISPNVNWIPGEHFYTFEDFNSKNSEKSYLPHSIRSKYFYNVRSPVIWIKDLSPEDKQLIVETGSINEYISLVELNDRGFSFSDIAHLIEKYM